MGIISSASASSCWRGLEYYKSNKIKNIKKINDIEYTSIACGTKEYNVYLNLKNSRKSTCNCPLANGKRVICKHIVATYFSVVPSSAKEFEDEQKRLQEEYEDYQEKQRNNVSKYIRKMTKEQLVNELLFLLDYSPEWVYEHFIREHDIES